MDTLIKTKRSSSRNKKDQRGDSFRIDETKGRKISPQIEWFSSLWRAETLMYVDH